MISGNIDMLVISETMLDETFPAAQFSLQGFCIHYRFDRNYALYQRGYTFATYREKGSK